MPTTELKANALPGIPTTYSAKAEGGGEPPEGSGGSGSAVKGIPIQVLS